MVEHTMQYYKLIGDEVKKMVQSFESRPKTTQDGYGGYMQLITILTDENIPLDIACQLLVKCGGNKQGIASAKKVIKGEL